MKSTITREDNGNIVLTILIPAEAVQKIRESEIEKAIENTTIEGFRKGKAPRNMVEDRLDQAKIQEEVLKKLLPQTYIEAVTEHKLKPVMSPRVHIEKVELGKDWQYSATICEAPIVELGKYKEEVSNITAKSKIILPGKEKEEVKFDEIMEAVLKAAKVAIPKILIEAEVERLLSQMLHEIKALGLNLDQYLASTNKTIEQLREDYMKKAEMDIKFEFILQQIAETEGITVEPGEIEEAIQKAKDPKEKQHLETNKYLLANIIRQQKTLDFLRNL